MIKILFFAQTRERLNCEQLDHVLDVGEKTVADLKTLLRQKDALWNEVLEADLLCAVNQTLVPTTHPIKDGDEVAFFPPVTGG